MSSLKSLIDSAELVNANKAALITALRAFSRGARGDRLIKSGSDLFLGRAFGNLIPINSNYEEIPDAGTTLAVGALTPGTLYYIYAYMSAGVLTLEASVTAHATQAGTGVEIKSGDATRTLVGMARVIAGPAWADTAAQRFVVSWANRRPIGGASAFTADRTTTSATYVEVNSEIRCEFLTWADEAVLAAIHGSIHHSGVNGIIVTGLGFDGTTAEETYTAWQAYANDAIGPTAVALVKSGLAEGYHYATLLGRTSGATATWDGSATPGDRTALTVGIRG